MLMVTYPRQVEGYPRKHGLPVRHGRPSVPGVINWRLTQSFIRLVVFFRGNGQSQAVALKGMSEPAHRPECTVATHFPQALPDKWTEKRLFPRLSFFYGKGSLEIRRKLPGRSEVNSRSFGKLEEEKSAYHRYGSRDPHLRPQTSRRAVE